MPEKVNNIAHAINDANAALPGYRMSLDFNFSDLDCPYSIILSFDNDLDEAIDGYSAGTELEAIEGVKRFVVEYGE